MKTMSFTKIAAVVCSAMSLVAMSAVTASAADIKVDGQDVEITLDQLKAQNYEVVFDRGGFIYAGKIQALADAAREAGLNF